MRFFPALFFLLCTLPAFAQTDSLERGEITATTTSFSVLKRADIERLPAESFLELVRGAFAFIGNTAIIEEEYSFVVNGFVTINPNAINLSQLETVSFYPAGTALTRGSLGKKGTFIITTRPQAAGISFSTKTGLLHEETEPTMVGSLHAGKGIFTLNELAYHHKSERSYTSGAVSALKMANPGFSYTLPGVDHQFHSGFSRIRASAFGGLQLGQHWQVEGALFFALQPQDNEGTSEYSQASTLQEGTEEQDLLYAGGNLALRFTPSGRFSNRLMAGITYAEEEEKTATLITNAATGDLFGQNSNTEGNFRTYAITNHMIWTPVSTAAIRLQASLLARYRQAKTEEKARGTSYTSQGLVYSGGFAFTSNSRSFAMTPALLLQVGKLLTAEGGATYDSYSSSEKGPNEAIKILPHAGLKLELAPLVQGLGIASLALSANYSQFYTAYDRNDRLETEYRDNLPGPPAMIANPANREYNPGKNGFFNLTLAAWQNRFAISGGYRLLEQEIKAYLPLLLPDGTTAYTTIYEPLTAKSWSVEVKTTLLEKPAKRWSLYTMAFHDKYERVNYSRSGGTRYSIPAGPAFLDAGKAPWRGGLRTEVALNRFFLQAAFLVSFNELGQNNSGTLEEDRTNYRANFLLAGYRWSLPKGWVKDIAVNLQSRNILSRGNDGYARYTGLGLHLQW